MIVDTIKNKDHYSALSSSIHTALDFLSNVKPENFKEQTLEIDGRNIFAMFQFYTTESEASHFYEAHDKYIDIQFIVAGEEVIRVANRELLTVTDPYDTEKDISFYSLVPGWDLLLKPGDFTMLFPWDAHAPKLYRKRPGKVKKVVVKVRFEE